MGLGVPSGVPALNAKNTYYFTGRSDNFDPTQISTNPNNARFDPEGVRVSNDGESIFISDEYGPYVYQ
ncbi:MAG: esterase-like activity of phytase family protein, partial [Nostoc sp.]